MQQFSKHTRRADEFPRAPARRIGPQDEIHTFGQARCAFESKRNHVLRKRSVSNTYHTVTDFNDVDPTCSLLESDEALIVMSVGLAHRDVLRFQMSRLHRERDLCAEHANGGRPQVMNVLHVVRPTADVDAITSVPHVHPIERSTTEPEVISRIVRGFYPDRLRAAFGFGDIEHRLLDSGEFEAQFLHVAMARLSLHVFHYSRPVALSGACPAGKVALIFRIGLTDRQMPHDHAFPTGGIAMFGSSMKIEVRLPPRAKFALLTLDRQHLEGVLEGLDPDRTECTPSGTPSATRELEGRRLMGLLRAVIDDADLTCTFLNSRECFAVFERDIVSAFGRAWSTAERSRGNGSSAFERRSRLVKKAEQYVIAHLDESIRMDRLCKEVGASARALEYAFHDVYGMGAMRYLRVVRLNEVRRALLESGASNPTTVTAAAMDWGFWHLGEFAAAYRQLFGEAPSATLRTAAAESIRYVPAI